MNYESSVTRASKVMDGVSYTIRKMSFGRRLELTRRIRELTRSIEFLRAGEDVHEKIEATLLSSEVERLYLEWGLQEVRGIEIDGREATCETLVSEGPEELCREIVAAIQSECGLSPDERKN